MQVIHLLKKKGTVATRLLVFLLAFCAPAMAGAQAVLHLEDHDNKAYYFGLTFSGSMARFQTEHHPYFLAQDSILVAEPVNSGGLSLGLLATARLSKRFELRFNPQLAFMDRGIYYKLNYTDRDAGTETTQKIESTTVMFPLQLKFNSDRIGNFRVYMLGGGKMDIDLASKARARKVDDLIKIQRMDYGFEAGLGFNFYFPSFILSPEIKLSNGLGNIHVRNEALRYSSVLDRIQSRMIVFSIHIEG